MDEQQVANFQELAVTIIDISRSMRKATRVTEASTSQSRTPLRYSGFSRSSTTPRVLVFSSEDTSSVRSRFSGTTVGTDVPLAGSSIVPDSGGHAACVCHAGVAERLLLMGIGRRGCRCRCETRSFQQDAREM